ncbi:MAG: archease [Candidatus Altiarchaeales archaeon]|nr:MAG: archease [Candidatus Altiarchaeales archaeon]
MKSKKKFEFLEHTADLEFIAYGDSLDECFENSARAIWNSIIDLNSVDKELKKEITINSDNLRELLHDFLSESLLIFETEGIVFGDFDVSIIHNHRYELSAVLYGEKFDPEKHLIRGDIKAVTYHKMLIREEGGRWSARVVCDV